MKIAIIYLSLSGNTAFVADQIKACNEHEVDLFPVKILEKVPKTRLFKTIKYSVKTIFNRPIRYRCDYDPAVDYDLLIIGTPVWADRIPSPIRVFLSELPLKEKNVAVYCTYDTKPSEIIDQLSAFTDSRPFTATMEIRDPLHRDQEAMKRLIGNFLRQIKTGEGD